MGARFRASILFLLAFYCTACSQKAEIYGQWYFDRFGGPHGEIANSGEIGKANKENEGMSFSFARDNKVFLCRRDGDSITMPYQLFPERREILLQGDTMRIMLLTKDILELFPISDTKPAMFLKRDKNGKTTMSAK